MALEILSEVGKVIVSAVAGGLITAASALPYMNNKISNLTSEVALMKESCTACKSGITDDLTALEKKVELHHEDDEKHYTKASDKLLNDILTRVMRIETRLFNGHSRLDD